MSTQTESSPSEENINKDNHGNGIDTVEQNSFMLDENADSDSIQQETQTITGMLNVSIPFLNVQYTVYVILILPTFINLMLFYCQIQVKEGEEAQEKSFKPSMSLQKKGQNIYKNDKLGHLTKKKTFLGRTKDEWCKIVMDLLLFYTTAFFVLLAIFSVSAMIFLIPFFIDPSWSTIQADFDEVGTECKTVVALERRGRNATMISI